MIDLKEVSFKNIFCFGNRTQTLELKKGLNLVVGNDVSTGRSNGSGKSSFMSLLSYGLYGKVEKDLPKDKIINSKNKKNLEVIINFTKNSENYSILRAIKPDKLELYRNGSLIDNIPNSVKDLQKYIEDEILNLNFKTFSNVVFTNANSIVPVMKMKKQQKREILEKIFDLQYFTKLNEACNTKRSLLNEKIRISEIDNAHLKKSIEEYNNEIELIQTKILNIRRSIKEFEEIEKEYDNYNSLKKNLEIDIKAIKIDDLHKEIRRISNIIEKINNKKSLLNVKIRNIKNNIEKEKETNLKIFSYNSEINKYKEDVLLKEKETNTKTILDNTKKLEELEKTKRSLENTILIEKSKLNLLIENNKNIFDKETNTFLSVCPTCKQSINTDTIELVIKEQEDKIKEIIESSDIKSVLKDIKEIKNIIDELKIKEEYTTNTLTKIDKCRRAIDLLKTTLSDIQYSHENYERAISKLDSTLSKFTKIENYKNKQLTEKQTSLEKKHQELEKVNNWLNNFNTLKTKRDMENNLLKDYQENIESYNNRIQSSEKSIKFNDKETKKNYKLIDYFDYLKFLCKDENIRQYVISSKIPYINQRVNHYLSEVGTGFYVVFDKWLDVDIRGPGISNFSYNNLSGGESKALDISLQIALSDLVSLQSISFPNILVYDEILDSSVDYEGIKSIMNIILLKQKEENNKTFIISHRNELKDFKFDNVYIVEKGKDGYSRITID